MKTWSKTDLLGLLLFLFGLVCLIFSNSGLLTITSLLLASLVLLHGIYSSRFDTVKYRDILCHYQAVLSSSSDGWIAWNIDNEYIGSSKKLRTLFGIKQTVAVSISEVLSSIDQKDANNLSFHFNKLKKTGAGFKLVVNVSHNNNRVEIAGSRMAINGIDTVLLWSSDITSSSTLITSIEKNFVRQEKKKILRRAYRYRAISFVEA